MITFDGSAPENVIELPTIILSFKLITYVSGGFNCTFTWFGVGKINPGGPVLSTFIIYCFFIPYGKLLEILLISLIIIIPVCISYLSTTP